MGAGVQPDGFDAVFGTKRGSDRPDENTLPDSYATEVAAYAMSVLELAPHISDTIVSVDGTFHLVARRERTHDLMDENLFFACGEEVWNEVYSVARPVPRGAWQHVDQYEHDGADCRLCPGCESKSAEYPGAQEREGDPTMPAAVVDALVSSLPEASAEALFRALVGRMCEADDTHLRKLIRYSFDRLKLQLNGKGSLSALLEVEDWEALVATVLVELTDVEDPADGQLSAAGALHAELLGRLKQRIAALS